MTAIYGLHRARKITPLLGDEGNGVSSILLYGPRGCGKTLLVNQLAEAWLSSNGDETNRAVESFRRGTNPDYFHISPRGAGALINVGQITPGPKKTPDDPIPLTEFIRVTPLYSRNKVIWIEDAHRMNAAAANSLLKTLEEPPAYVKIILTTSQVSQIPATILSRCLVINCELPTSDELHQIYPGVPEDLLALSEGTPGTLERIAANPDLYREIVHFGDRLVSCSQYSAMILGEDFRKLSDRLEEIEKQGARNSNARTIELIAISVARRHPNRPEAVRLLTEAHKRILANANASFVIDAVFGKIALSNFSGTN